MTHPGADAVSTLRRLYAEGSLADVLRRYGMTPPVWMPSDPNPMPKFKLWRLR